MQSKISSFFKPFSSSASQTQAIDPLLPLLENPSLEVDEDEDDFTREPEIPIIYTRRTLKTDRENCGVHEGYDFNELELGEEQLALSNHKKVLNKKRKYAQFHLDLGQSDFLFRTCKTCGFKFVPGDEDDTKLHKEFHKNYTHGIGLKGWRNERVIDLDSLENNRRVIMVLNDDTPAHIKKVEEVIKMMEMELGDGWIFHKHCKVYLFISSHRVAGCLVAESIQKAYRLISNSNKKSNTRKEGKLTSTTTLQFGSISFQREIVRNNASTRNEKKSEVGAIICETEAVPAQCGIRAIWVSPSNRRKHVATHLLEAAR